MEAGGNDKSGDEGGEQGDSVPTGVISEQTLATWLNSLSEKRFREGNAKRSNIF